MKGPKHFDALRAEYASKALNTWVVGHRGLFVLCRELHRSLVYLDRTVRKGDRSRASTQLARLAAITRACNVAFKISGEMTKEEYDANVVAPMVKAHPAFTGLWARDHSAMLNQLGSTFSSLKGFEAERANVRLVTKFMVAQHERICERFAKGRPSLNASARSGMTANDEEGYVRLRDKFGSRHVRLVDAREAKQRGVA